MRKSQKNVKKTEKISRNPYGLTPRQARFVDEYIIDLNGTQAAIRAGYSPKTAEVQASKLLSKANIQQAIKDKLEERSRRTGITQDYVLKNLQEVVERCMQRAPVCNMKGEQIKDEQGRDVWQFNGRDANKAIELLGKHLGMFQGSGTGRPQKHRDILQRYNDGELTLKEAAIQFEINGLPLPDTIRILLGKEQPEPDDPTKGEYRTITDEEMEARVAERMANINAQLDELPERREEIRELHKQVADKFAPGNTQKTENQDG